MHSPSLRTTAHGTIRGRSPVVLKNRLGRLDNKQPELRRRKVIGEGHKLWNMQDFSGGGVRMLPPNAMVPKAVADVDDHVARTVAPSLSPAPSTCT